MIKIWKEVLSDLNSEDVPHFLITVFILIYLEIYFTIKFLKIFKKVLTNYNSPIII